MKVHHIGSQNSVLNHFLSEIRNIEVQSDRMRFRRNIERIGEILSYELSKTLTFRDLRVTTPLGTKKTPLIEKEIVICSILRAGVPLHQGILNYFDKADNAFISAYRHHISETEFEIRVEYLASPDLENKILILADPMLATGRSFQLTLEALKNMGTPSEIHLISVLASKPGIALLEKQLNQNIQLWTGDIDDELNDLAYIVPGLGDAGDLSFGSKLQH